MKVLQVHLAVGVAVVALIVSLVFYTGHCAEDPLHGLHTSSSADTSAAATSPAPEGPPAASEESSTTAAAEASAQPKLVTPRQAAESAKPVQLYNSASDRLLFVSGKQLENASLIGAKKLASADEASAQFLLQPVGSDRYSIVSSASQLRLFVPDQRLVAADANPERKRAEFEFVSAGSGDFYIYCPGIGEYLFLSEGGVEGEAELRSSSARGGDDKLQKFRLLQS